MDFLWEQSDLLGLAIFSRPPRFSFDLMETKNVKWVVSVYYGLSRVIVIVFVVAV